MKVRKYIFVFLHIRRVWSIEPSSLYFVCLFCLLFGEAFSSRNTPGETRQAWFVAKGMICCLLYPSQFAQVTTNSSPYQVSDWISQDIRTVGFWSPDNREFRCVIKANELAFSKTVADTVGQLHGRGLAPCRVNSGSRRSLTSYCTLDFPSESLV